ncbi:uncharacterized protein LOC113360557 [Papaver somniferum]|uniref:uncharacterized protein LOC113360557 n=1 Tax=Papaver somniferum TaxID=3469 RepID=UPI000E6FF9C7|nr:uncharacterized protein LOC113360557 [Papaver somniferum]
MSLFKKTYGSNIKYHHARRGKEVVFEEQIGDDEKSYSDLTWYVKAIEKTSPDSFVKLEVDEETGRFQRIFICFGACKHRYTYLRPMIYLDATFLTGRFRDNLKQVVDGRPIVFLSNRHEGLLQGIPRVFPGSHHSYCFYHIKCNLPIGSGDANSKAAIDLFYKAAYSYITTNFEEALRGMHAIGCGHVAIISRLFQRRNGKMHFSILKVMKKNSERMVEDLEDFNTKLTHVYEAILKENIDIGLTWTVVQSMERLYEFKSPRSHSIDLLERTCTCHRWRVNGFPCAHATREDIYSYIEPYFTTEWYNRTYQEIILSIPNYDKPQSYDPSDRIIVPIHVPPPGR